ALLKRMLRLGGASAVTEALRKGTTPSEVATAGAIGAALPPAWKALKLPFKGAARLATRISTPGQPIRLPLISPLITRFQASKYFGALAPRVREAVRQMALGQERSPQIMARLQGEMELIKRGVGKERFPGILKALQADTGPVTPQFLGRVARKKTYARRGITPEFVEQAFAKRHGLLPGEVGAVRQTRRLTQSMFAQRQALRMSMERADMLRGTEFGQKVGSRAKELLGAGISRQTARAQAFKETLTKGMAGIREKFPVKGARFWESYFPTGQRATHFILAPAIGPSGKLAYRLAPGRPLPQGLKQADKMMAEIAEDYGIDPKSLIAVPTRPRTGTITTQVSRGAFFSTIQKLSEGLGLSKKEVITLLGEKGPMPIGIRQPFRKGKFIGSDLYRRGLLDQPTEGLEEFLRSSISQHARFTGLTQPLREAGALQPLIEKLAGGPETGPAKYWQRYISSVAGQPTQFERRVADAVDRIALRPGPFQDTFRREAGNPFALRKFVAKVRAFQTVSKLGFRLLSPLVNTTQTILNTQGVMGPRITARSIWEATHNTEKWQWLYQDARIFHTFGRAEQLFEQEVGAFGQKMIKIGLYAFQASESLNRRVAAIAGYLGALEKAGISGGGVAPWTIKGSVRREGVEAARDLIFRTQFHYGTADVPSFMEGPIGALVGQFKPFIINQIGFIMG
ncbi:hypothetical protein LCGC14_2093430, partial [marine sediment metagenome]